MTQRKPYARRRPQRAELWERMPDGRDVHRLSGEVRHVLAVATGMIQAGCKVSVRAAGKGRGRA